MKRYKTAVTDYEGMQGVLDTHSEQGWELFSLTPGKIIEYLDLRRPIYRLTAAGGHFGRDEASFSWEKTNRAAELSEAAGVATAAR